MFLKNVFLLICGLSFGLLSSAGVFTVLASVGLIPRFAGKMHVAHKVFALEEAVVFGTILGCIVSVFQEYADVGSWVLMHQILGEATETLWKWFSICFLILGGLFAGMFVGCLALSIAEMLDSIPIFSRRIGFRHGLGIAITAVALGKLVGSILYFAKGIFESGM